LKGKRSCCVIWGAHQVFNTHSIPLFTTGLNIPIFDPTD